ncbi:MAG: 1-deoxy-D-xylulose-5-phosphate synthase [Oscillospiraceae bacterium]
MNDLSLLKNIKNPNDVKKLTEDEIPILADEIRQVLIDTVSKNGGHLASNLGVVELTIALHRVFDSPKDKIIWDVGHQSYTHKLLTGRFDDFETLRTENGISGFTRPSESEHDVFYSGHASTSISAALGVATANELSGNKHSTIAIIGDGALTGGLAFEGLNNAGRSKQRLIVILNDNEMSISKNVGSVARYLAVLRARPEYYKFKLTTETVLEKIPFIGTKIADGLFKIKTRIKSFMYKSTFFEELGFRYMGPIDGHNINQLCDALESAKIMKGPVLLHISTIKGKGYDFAEKSPSEFHGISKFNINTGEPVCSGTNFSNEFGEFLCDIASKDKRICAVTAAMSLGTGLENFSKEYENRFFDVGIAEEHAVTFSSGLSKGGMMPVFAVYSSFLQRCYDQLIHDCSLQNLHMIFAIDRAGFVGEDGVSHQGIFDVALLNSIPNVTIFSPSTYEELKSSFVLGIYHNNGVVAVRYPRGTEKVISEKAETTNDNYNIYGKENSEIFIITYGRLSYYAFEAQKALIEKGYDVSLLKLNRIKPIDVNAVRAVSSSKNVYFFEEGTKAGGIGETFAGMLYENEFTGKYVITAVNNEFVEHASVNSLLAKYNLDTNGIIKIVMEK